jgi:prolyl oligopeptidase
MNPTLIMALLLLPMILAAAPNLPSTPRRPVTESFSGQEIVDPYRWLEGDEAGHVTPEVAAWTDQQNAHTRDVLDHLPGRTKVEARLKELMELPSTGLPHMRRNRYFYSHREGSQNQSSLFLREGIDGQPRLLLDPNSLDPNGLVTLSWFEPNPTGSLLAFGTFRSGDENSVAKVLNVDTGQWLADEIPGKVGNVQWLPDSSGFFYHCLADLKNPYSGQIKFHRLGENNRADALLFEQYKTGPLATTWGPDYSISPDARWFLLSYATSTKSNDLWVVDLDRWVRTREFITTPIITGADAQSGGEISGDTLLMHTTLDASNGRIIAVDLNNPAREHWKDFIPERPDAVIQHLSLARGILAVTYQKSASTLIELFDLHGQPLGPVALPGIGSASLSAYHDRTEAFLAFTSFNTPPTIYHLDLKTGQRTLWNKLDVPVDPSIIEVQQVFYPSKDGTKISMFLVHKKGLALDGNNPTLLTGYGGFGIGMTPYFSPTLFPFLEAGGVFALPNLRGGSEYGDAWHMAGMLDKKQNVFDDFIWAAEYLISHKYTNPTRLAISGGSNGGLLVGAAITQRPDLFSAAVCDVPLLDMLRYQKFLMARYWVPEYGSAENPEQFKYLLKYSPYQNVKPGVKYPAVLFGAGENDARVHPLHARKMAALLQAASASDPVQKPILLWVERQAGHGGGKPLSLRLRDETDRRMFLMWQLGMIK